MKLSGTRPDQRKISPFGILNAFQSVSYNLVFIEYCFALFFNNFKYVVNAETPNSLLDSSLRVGTVLIQNV